MSSVLPHRNNGRVRVFLTGATGFVGGAIARALAHQGAEIHALVRPTADRSALDGLPIIWHEGDVNTPLRLNGVVAEMTYVIHAAGRLGEAGVPEQARVFRSWMTATKCQGSSPGQPPPGESVGR